MKEIFIEYLPKIIEYIIIIIVGLLSHKAKKLIDTDVKKSVVSDTVNYVEQVYKHIHGKDKLDIAMDKTIDLLLEKGIKIKNAELNILIESAVAQMNRSDSVTKKFVESLKEGSIDEFNVSGGDT